MLKLSVIALSFSFVSFAQATSLHPCTPVVQAMPTYISCVDGNNGVSITINTVMSPAIEMCQGKNYFEYKSAEVDFNAGAPATFLSSGEFDYSLNPTGDASFSSEKLGLNLTKCVTPIHGGVSFGY